MSSTTPTRTAAVTTPTNAGRQSSRDATITAAEAEPDADRRTEVAPGATAGRPFGGGQLRHLLRRRRHRSRRGSPPTAGGRAGRGGRRRSAPGRCRRPRTGGRSRATGPPGRHRYRGRRNATARYPVRAGRAGRRRRKGVSWAGKPSEVRPRAARSPCSSPRRRCCACAGTVRSSSSFSARRTSSSPDSPSLTRRSSSSFARRRMLRMATLASSPLARAIFTRSRRRSSVSCGKTTRRTWPSFVGFTPRSLSRMAFSMERHLAGVVGLDDRHARLGDGDRGHLRHRGRRAVVVHDDLVEHGGRGPAGAHRAEVLAGDRQGLVHPLLGVEQGVVDHGSSLHRRELVSRRRPRMTAAAQNGWLISVPILSPATARAMLPSRNRLNTTIGIWLSMHRLMAVASATLSCLASTVA